ncbi:hypothetical protein ACFQ0T_17825 [Kitasatospora gansuensis]
MHDLTQDRPTTVSAAAPDPDPDEVLRVCADLIAAPSENPGGDEEAAAAVVERYLGSSGFHIRRVYARPGRPTCWPPSTGGPAPG